MKKFSQFWEKLSNGGVQADHDFEDVKRIRIINQFCVVSFIVAMGYVLLLLSLGSVYLALFDFNIAFWVVIVMVLIRKTNYNFGANVLMLTAPLALLLISKEYGRVGAEYYYFPLLIFSYYIFKRIGVLVFYIILLLGLFILAKFYEINSVPTGLSALLRPYFYYTNIACSFMIGAIFLRLFVREHIRHQKEMEEKNIQLEAAVSEAGKKNAAITVLMKELNHRTKNNLQLVSSLMNLQAEKLPKSEARSLLEDSTARIASIALLHQKLYRDETLTQVYFKGYFEELIAHLQNIFDDKNHPAHIESSVDDFVLNIDNAVTLGLILNELLTNSFKHGIMGIEQKKISISIKRNEPDSIEIAFSDNGKGLPRIMETSGEASFGAELIQSLITQLDGKMTFPEAGKNFVHINLHLNHQQ